MECLRGHCSPQDARLTVETSVWRRFCVNRVSKDCSLQGGRGATATDRPQWYCPGGSLGLARGSLGLSRAGQGFLSPSLLRGSDRTHPDTYRDW
jgi:hypothetical protein